MKTILKNIISNINEIDKKEGFTKFLFGENKRYVVGLTHNENPNIELLKKQIKKYINSFDNLTLGGWLSDENIFYLDIGTSTNSLKEARNLQKQYDQIAIFDLVKSKEL